MSRGAVVVAALALVVIPVAAGAGGEPPKPNQPNQLGKPASQPAQGPVMRLKPDLVVEKLWVTGTQPDPSGGTQVNVKFTIYNNSPTETNRFPTAAALQAWHQQPVMNWFFQNWVDWREYPNGMFPPLQGNGATADMLGPFGRLTWAGTVVVPAGKRVEIRATVDSLNWVDESNETNNSTTIVWPAVILGPAPRK